MAGQVVVSEWWGGAVVPAVQIVLAGLAVVEDSIVEVGVISEDGAIFSTVVRPPFTHDEAACGSCVHGIQAGELLAGPDFSNVYARMTYFIEHLQVSTVEPDGSDSDADEPRVVRSYSDPPRIVLVAHNGFKFDFAILASEVLRAGADWLPLQRWCYLDTLDVFKAIGSTGCVKLQCLRREVGVGNEPLRAHRALDDAIALRSLVISQAERLGLTIGVLLAPFVVGCDADATLAQERCLRMSRRLPKAANADLHS